MARYRNKRGFSGRVARPQNYVSLPMRNPFTKRRFKIPLWLIPVGFFVFVMIFFGKRIFAILRPLFNGIDKVLGVGGDVVGTATSFLGAVVDLPKTIYTLATGGSEMDKYFKWYSKEGYAGGIFDKNALTLGQAAGVAAWDDLYLQLKQKGEEIFADAKRGKDFSNDEQKKRIEAFIKLCYLLKSKKQGQYISRKFYNDYGISAYSFIKQMSFAAGAEPLFYDYLKYSEKLY